MTIRPLPLPAPVQFSPAERDVIADLVECRQATMKVVDREDELMAARIRSIARKIADAKAAAPRAVMTAADIGIEAP